MTTSQSRWLSLRARVAAAVFGLACSCVTFASVVLAFASASGELDPLVARMKASPAASEVASRQPAKPARSAKAS